jgi:transposase
MTDHPDEVLTCEPGRCAGCGNGLCGAPVTGTGRRQVVDLPGEIRALVTEHRIISRRCSCGTVTAGAAPAGVSAPVQYGPRISAVAAYLWHGQFLSRGRTCEQSASCSASRCRLARSPPWSAGSPGSWAAAWT